MLRCLFRSSDGRTAEAVSSNFQVFSHQSQLPQKKTKGEKSSSLKRTRANRKESAGVPSFSPQQPHFVPQMSVQPGTQVASQTMTRSLVSNSLVFQRSNRPSNRRRTSLDCTRCRTLLSRWLRRLFFFSLCSQVFVHNRPLPRKKLLHPFPTCD